MPTRYKRLDVPLWALDRDFCKRMLSTFRPVFGKDGHYLDRTTGVEWIEVGGEACLTPRGGIAGRLHALSVRPLTQREETHAKALVDAGAGHLLTDEARERLRETLRSAALTRSRREVRLMFRRMGRRDLTRRLTRR